MIRNLLEHALRIARINEEQERQSEFMPHSGEMWVGDDFFDLTPWENGSKQYALTRLSHDLEKLDLVVAHVSGVRGGFGVSRRSVKRWTRLLDTSSDPDGMHPISILKVLPEEILEALPAGDLQKRARRLALWERYRNVPYHQIGAANGDNIANHSLDRWTWHGNLGNFGVGWALDCGGGSGVLDDWLIETGRASLHSLLYRIDPARHRPIRVAHHRAFTDTRRRDTGLAVHREVILPVVESLDHVSIAYEMKRGKGRPVPFAWDPTALFDAKGRRIR